MDPVLCSLDVHLSNAEPYDDPYEEIPMPNADDINEMAEYYGEECLKEIYNSIYKEAA